MRPGLHQLRVASVRLEDDVQSRARHNATAIHEFSVAMKQGKKFPPIVVFYDGDTYWCGDGFHRVQAARRAKLTHISAAVRKGGKREALLHSVGANFSHGIRRTNKDKRRAVSMLLQDPEWTRWSSREIGRRAGVSHTFVDSVRATLTGNGLQSPTKRIGADGRAIDTTNIGAGAQKVEEVSGTQPSKSEALSGSADVATTQRRRSDHVATDTAAKPPPSGGRSAVDDLNAAATAFLGFLSHESDRLVESAAQGQASADDAGRQLTTAVASGATILNQTRDGIVRIMEDARQRIGAGSSSSAG